MNPTTMSKRRLVEYLAHVGQRGFCFVPTSKGYELVAVGTGQLASFDAISVIEAQLRTQGQEIAQLKAANVLVQADLARIELMMDSMLREGDLTQLP